MGVVHTLQLYLAAGILQPGPRKLSCSVGGEEHYADLGANGQIHFEGLEFSTPSSFSLYIKRKQNPARKADDGWTSVKYEGTSLFELRELCDLREEPDGADRPHLRDLKSDFGAERGRIIESGRGRGARAAPRGEAARAAGGDRPARGGTPGRGPDSNGSHSADAHANGSNQSGGGMADGGRAWPNGCRLVEGQNWPCVNRGKVNEIGGAGGGYDEGGREWRGRNNGVKAEGGVKGEGEDRGATPAPSANGDETWILCEKCDRWRRIKMETVPDGPWQCCMNADKRFASCDAPQEMSDAEVDSFLEEEQLRRYVSNSPRPPLDVCTSSEFEADLISFLRELGEGVKADQIRCKRVQCNNRPLDVFGLYTAVVECGGFIANEKYDEHKRWIGTLNFAGVIFPKLANYTKDNRATSVGNQLLCNYRKFLYDYERAWRHVDVFGAERPWPASGRRGAPGPAGPRAVDRAAGMEEMGCCEEGCVGGSGTRGASPDSDLSGPSARRYSALLMLAGIMCAERDSPKPAACGPPGSKGPRDHWREAQRAVAKAEEDDDRGDRDAGGSPGVECGHGEEVDAEAFPRVPAPPAAAPAQLLLARDPNRPGLLWPVVAAAREDLPASVAQGYSNDVAKWVGFPLSFKELIPGAVPVLVFGSDALGWAHEGLCQPFEPGLAAALYQEALRSEDPSEEQVFYRRVLKQALQYGADAQPAPVNCVAPISLEMVAANLVGLESDLPTEVLGGQNFATWHQWRTRVRKAETAAGLASEALLLFYQIDPDVIRRGASGLWQELEHLLGIGQTKVPTILSVDSAIHLMKNTIDWIRTYRRLQASGKSNSSKKRAGVKRRAGEMECSKDAMRDQLS
ncbi:unnamed protein product [Ostreobium quekettii]|uniref:CW-type domain-containing protein n=1 Tax=Ostreobium quekettii TaxID=121088 RepID=A0A8S1J092_9CHLO|nr:unnamed protein product [Ostreobium quekettii]|eukprot:evm.model.scf_1954.1 EVM.evm.TU.scf_1954.1   scf_1954:1800-9677(+)